MKSRLICGIVTALIVMTGIGAIVVKSWKDFEERNPVSGPVTTPAATVQEDEDLSGILNSDALILHIDVDWSANAVYARPLVTQFKNSLEQDPRLSGIVFRRVDLTNQSGPIWDSLEKWLSDQEMEFGVLSGGGGSIIWAKGGKVVDYRNTVVGVTNKRLVQITRYAFVGGFPIGRASSD